METVNLKETVEYLKNLPEDTFDVAKKEIATALFKADTKIKTKTTLNKRTGNLFKSMQVKVQGSEIENLKASIYTTSVYAPSHEYGSTIKAQNAYKNVPGGPYLNIPIFSNLTPAGVMRKTAKQVFNMGGNIVKFKSGKYGLMLNGQAVFVLVKQIKLKKRLNMHKYTEEQIPTMLSNIANQIGEN